MLDESPGQPASSVVVVHQNVPDPAHSAPVARLDLQQADDAAIIFSDQLQAIASIQAPADGIQLLLLQVVAVTLVKRRIQGLIGELPGNPLQIRLLSSEAKFRVSGEAGVELSQVGMSAALKGRMVSSIRKRS